jgi:hypothetical protein
MEMDFGTLDDWIGLDWTGSTPLFDCALCPRRSSGMEGGGTVTNLGLGLVTSLIAAHKAPIFPSSQHMS